MDYPCIFLEIDSPAFERVLISKVDYSDHGVDAIEGDLRPEVKAWCNESLSFVPDVDVRSVAFYGKVALEFENEADMLVFKMRWDC